MIFFLFRVSSAVEQWTVNPLVASSNLAPGDSYFKGLKIHKKVLQRSPWHTFGTLANNA